MSTTTAWPGSVSQGQRLAQHAAAAAEVRAYQSDPDVVALRVEQIRAQVTWLMWAGIGLGLCFTMTNVQAFAAAGAPVGSGPWLAAWLLDPTVSLVLLAVLRAEQITARWQVPTGAWPRVAKWVLLTARLRRGRAGGVETRRGGHPGVDTSGHHVLAGAVPESRRRAHRATHPHRWHRGR